MSESAILTILRWAAGAPEDVSGIKAVDAEPLLRLLRTHNLITRFYHRCRQERPPWFTRALFLPVWTEARAIEGRMQRQIRAIQEISEALPPDAHPLIVIKGPATFATTGEPRHRRHSGDLDLLCRDSDCLWETLLALGYAGKRNDGGLEKTKSDAHEFAVLSRGETVIEIHSHFPVAGYPAAVREADLVPVRHPGRWVQPLPTFLQSQIGYDLLAAHCVESQEPDTLGLCVPNPAASVLVLCAHEFRNFLHAPFTGMTVRLSALADVHDLARHPRFDAGRFLAWTAQTGAADSAAFVAALLHTYYGDNPLPVASAPFESARFPQCLSYSGGWAALTGPEDILLQSGTETLAPRLGVNSITAEDVASSLPRLILNSPDVPNIELSAHGDPTALHLRVAFPDPLPAGHEYEIYLQSRDQSHGGEVWDWQFLADGPPVQNLSFPWPSLPGRFRQEKKLPLMLAIGRYDPDERLKAGWFSGNAVGAVAVVPLEICWEP